jgi:hypothetical protein
VLLDAVPACCFISPTWPLRLVHQSLAYDGKAIDFAWSANHLAAINALLCSRVGRQQVVIATADWTFQEPRLTSTYTVI